MSARRPVWFALGCLVCACGGRGGDDTGGVDVSITTGESTTGDGDGDMTMKWDVVGGDETGMMDGGDEAGDDGCKKVDLLFVIDNSGSMEDEQVSLVNSFPGFIDEIQSQLADTEGYHVGIISSDLYAYNGPGCLVEGGLITQTGGTGSSMSVCSPFAEGKNYMTEADDLATKFSCAAQIGIAGDGNERPAQTLIQALSPQLAGVGQCNEGFLRDDALLVIVIITDEEDDHEVDGCMQLPQPGSNGDPPGWYQAVIAAKNGVEGNIVVLALVGPPGPDPAICPALDKCTGGIIGAEVASRLVQFTQMFSHGFIGRICEPTYDSFFQEAVGEIKSACDDFMPPG
jgi:hypothetical protein